MILINIRQVIYFFKALIKTNIINYYLGRTRLRVVSVITLSVIMCTASVHLIIEGGQRLSQDIQYFQNRHNVSSTKTLQDIDMVTFPAIVMIFSIGKI